MIYAECYLDTLFARLILKIDVDHLFGFGETVKQLVNNTNNSSALIDKVKRQGPSFEKFEIIKSTTSVEFRKFNDKKIVYISIGLERYILKICSENNVDLSSFNLPNSFEELKKVTKKSMVQDDIRVHKLFEHISELKITEIDEIKNWLE